ncbi:MAG: pilus assembly protein CpaE [Chloroflexi bacterium]|nr:MAG: pilus assembly protein CpaE [Chloroflexota bacterium]
MISVSLARKLKEAGLAWTPQLNDFFAIPDRGLDDIIFVVSNMTVMVEEIRGQKVMTFQGAVEWALDYILTAELIWLPTETQLRELLEQRLVGEPPPALVLTSTEDGYRCQIHYRGQTLVFEGFGVSEVYGEALLYLMRR